jgi:hypothetical protein
MYLMPLPGKIPHQFIHMDESAVGGIRGENWFK